MDSSSTLIVGDYDKLPGNVDLLLEKYGFVERVPNVYEKPKTIRISHNAKSNINYYPYQY